MVSTSIAWEEYAELVREVTTAQVALKRLVQSIHIPSKGLTHAILS